MSKMNKVSNRKLSLWHCQRLETILNKKQTLALTYGSKSSKY